MRLLHMAVAGVVVLLLELPSSLRAQQFPAPMLFSAGELEQLASPIALYPDPLLAQVLMAATYPLEVVQAARFVRANPTLNNGGLNEALRAQDWDDSVKALAQFPQILDMMDDQADWTRRLGDAFLAQQGGLMDAVQALRARAQAQGTLVSSPQQIVRVQAPVIYIEPVSPHVIYVPVYSPILVYGSWPYPAYPPYYYRPLGWPVERGFYSFSGGVLVGSGLWGNCDWHRRIVFVDAPRYRRYTAVVNVPGRQGAIVRGTIGTRLGDRLTWQHDARRRESAWYQHPTMQQHVSTLKPPIVPPREPFRGRGEQPRVEPPRVDPSRVEQPRAAQPRAEHPRPEQGQPHQGRGGQEAIRPGVQPAPRPETSRPNPGDAPRMTAQVPARPTTTAAPRRDPGERGHATRESVALSTPTGLRAHAEAVTTGSVQDASSPRASSGATQGGGWRR